MMDESEIPALLYRCDAALLPSETEGLPSP
jgi:hypothetical protein